MAEDSAYLLQQKLDSKSDRRNATWKYADSEKDALSNDLRGFELTSCASSSRLKGRT